MPTPDVTALDLEQRLAEHLRRWLGRWPPADPDRIEVVAAPQRGEPGWDGQRHALIGVSAPGLGTVLSVAPTHADAVGRALDDLTDPVQRRTVADLVGGPATELGRGVFRALVAVVDDRTLPDAGTWVEASDPRLPPWLHPFNGGVLASFDGRGDYAAGVGIKRHDAVGREISVGTAEHQRGRGLARRLVAQAARAIVAEGGVATYLHGPDNVASARVADAAGLPDRGWHVWGLFSRG